ncbi:MAG TPA: SusD/RagB family nutrient-binding outer membrane lipoprotein, partial [Pedobacter sp.]
MKTTRFYLLYIAFAFTALASCEKFDHFTSNPNQPTQADPSLELTNIEQTAFATISTDPALASRYLVYTQSTSLTQYYGWQRGAFSYADISQVVKMEQEAQRTGKPDYQYLGKFFRSYYILNMAQMFGDVPYSKALQTMYGNLDSSAVAPAYDKQQQIYLQVLNDLKIASDSLVNDGSITGDIIYNGDVSKWKKLINSFTLRILMSLSLKESDASLNIKQRFNDIVSNPSAYPLMESNTDNGELQYYNITKNQYPYYNDNGMKTDYYLDSSFVRILKASQDPRL